jgi:hypothetical protein
MKRFIGIGVCLLALTIASTDVFAWSLKRGAEFIKNPSRCATINSVDAAQYNPAGLINLQDGIYIYLGNQAAFKKYTTQVRSAALGYMRDAVDTTPAFLSPNATLAYVIGSGAVFATFDVIGGGGTVNYQRPEGVNFVTALTSGAQRMSQISLYEGKTAISAGASYGLFNDKVSIAAGIRYVMVDRSVTGNVNMGRAISQSMAAAGWTGFIGINIQPNQMFNLALLFQPTMRLAGTWHDHMTNQNGSVYAGSTLLGILPFVTHSQEYEDGFFSVGAGIRPMEALEIQLSFKYGFGIQRRYGNYAPGLPTGISAVTFENNKARQEWDLAIGFEYSLGLIRPSMGVMYSQSSDRNWTNIGQPWDPGLSSTLVGIGFAIVPNDTIRIDLGVSKVFYAEGSAAGGTYTYKKDVWLIGYGVALHF